MFASIALGRRIERAEARLSASLGRAVISGEPAAQAFVHEMAGGVAVYTGPASPVNKMIGAGFDGAASDEELRAVEDKFRERRAPLQAEVATLADPAFVAQLTRRGSADATARRATSTSSSTSKITRASTRRRRTSARSCGSQSRKPPLVGGLLDGAGAADNGVFESGC